MAKIQPPKKKIAAKSEPNTVAIEEAIEKAKPKAATEQTPPESIKPLQLKIPETIKNDFKSHASMRGMAMNDFFLEMFSEYKEKHN